MPIGRPGPDVAAHAALTAGALHAATADGSLVRDDPGSSAGTAHDQTALDIHGASRAA